METFSKGNSNGAVSKSVPEQKCGQDTGSNGTMNYTSVQDSFTSADIAKVKKNAYKFDRYK